MTKQERKSIITAIVNGNEFKIKSQSYNTYKFTLTPDDMGNSGYIVNSTTNQYQGNIDKVGRVKLSGYSFVMDKRVKIELNAEMLELV
jgi:hypothetical protein